MAISYNNLRKLLIPLSGVSLATITKLDRNENVNTEILRKIFTALELWGMTYAM